MLGDFGDIIEKRQYSAASSWLGLPALKPNNIVVYGYLYNQSVEIKSFSCDPLTGDISNAFLSQRTMVNGYCIGCSPVFHIAGNVFGICFYQQYYYNQLRTFSVDNNGIISAAIATYVFATSAAGTPCGAEVVHVAGTTYWTVHSRVVSGTYYMRTWTWSISDDGMTMSNISNSTWTMAPGNSYIADIRQISGNTYGVFLHFKTDAHLIRTYTISDAGAISYIGQHTLDTGGSSSAIPIKACKVNGATNVFAVAYINGAATCRVKTLEINADGSFGADLDTDDTLFGKLRVLQLYNIAGSAYMLSVGTSFGDEVKSFTIDGTGTIGAIIDTLAGVAGYGCFIVYLGVDDMYTGIYQYDNPSFNIFGFSVGVKTTAGYTQGHVIG